MFKQLRMKIAARRVEANKKKEQQTGKPVKTKKVGFWATVGYIIAWPFVAIANLFKKLWQWIRSIDLIGLLNLTLLIAIITLFSILIMDICKCGKSIVMSRDNAPTISAPVVESKPKAEIVTVPENKPAEIVTLPLKKVTIVSRVYVHEERQKLYGDIIVDGEFPGERLNHGVKIDGSLYLQNMRRYTLPCGAHIEGNLFLRDVNMLKFCGDFVVTGNIYVSRRSSFGPIPRTARLGGQVIF